MLTKIHKKGDQTILAICDTDLLGKRIEENKVVLDLEGDFYRGEEKDINMIMDMMRNVDMVNMVGEKSIALGQKEGILDKEDIKVVQGVPHAQVLLVD
tara:strand:+ start:4214 stop:4507 length:294 start_codon:yes stop_codon:yes gene_type:complete